MHNNPAVGTTPATVKVRPITYAEIEALAHNRETSTVDVFVSDESAQHGFTVSPATLTITPRRRSRTDDDTVLPHREFYPMVPNAAPNAQSQWNEDKTQPPVGYALDGNIKTMFGTETGVHLFTSPEAEETAAQCRGWSNPSRARALVHVADPKGGEEQRLTPVFGAQVNLNVVLADIDPDEARERVEALLRAEFGNAMRPHAKIQSRPVRDRRVNVYTVGEGREPLALGILDSEVSYFMRSGACTVEEVDPVSHPIAYG